MTTLREFRLVFYLHFNQQMINYQKYNLFYFVSVMFLSCYLVRCYTRDSTDFCLMFHIYPHIVLCTMSIGNKKKDTYCNNKKTSVVYRQKEQNKMEQITIATTVYTWEKGSVYSGILHITF